VRVTRGGIIFDPNMRLMDSTKNRYKPEPAGRTTVEAFLFYETLDVVKLPIHVDAIPKKLRFEVYEYLHEASDMGTEWLIETMQLWDRLTAAKAESTQKEAKNDNLDMVEKDFVLACALVAYKLRRSVALPPVDDPIASLEQRDDEVIVVKILAMGKAIGEAEQQQQWQRIKVWEKGIWEFKRALIAPSAATDGSGNGSCLSVCLADYAVELSGELHALANPPDVAVAAATQVFPGWESTQFGNETITAHCLVTTMLIELAFMHLLDNVYAISSAAVAGIAASIALERFPGHATVPLLQEYLLGITCRFIENDSEAQLCKIFEERLLDLWRRPPSSCVVVKRWAFRAERNQLLAMVAPPAVKIAMTSSPRKRVNNKTSVWVGEPAVERAIAVLEDGALRPVQPNKKRKSYYIPVAKKKSGGARANTGRKKKSTAKA
jgi:hypothetical protein